LRCAAILSDGSRVTLELLPLLSLLTLLSLWVVSEVGQFYRDLPDANTDANTDEQEYHHDF
jgi:hypothetical protein